MARDRQKRKVCSNCGKHGHGGNCRPDLMRAVAMLRGLSMKEIANRLGISVRMADDYWRRWRIKNGKLLFALGFICAAVCLGFSLDPKDAPKPLTAPRPGTNIYNAVVFAVGTNGPWSEPSNLVTWTNASRTNKAWFAWDEIDPTVTNFPLFVWPKYGDWTNRVDAGTNKTAGISLRAPTKTNRWMTVSNWYFSANSLWGPWLTNTGPTVTNLSNVVGMKFFRGTTNKPAWVSPVHFY